MVKSARARSNSGVSSWGSAFQFANLWRSVRSGDSVCVSLPILSRAADRAVYIDESAGAIEVADVYKS